MTPRIHTKLDWTIQPSLVLITGGKKSLFAQSKHVEFPPAKLLRLYFRLEKQHVFWAYKRLEDSSVSITKRNKSVNLSKSNKQHFSDSIPTAERIFAYTFDVYFLFICDIPMGYPAAAHAKGLRVSGRILDRNGVLLSLSRQNQSGLTTLY